MDVCTVSNIGNPSCPVSAFRLMVPESLVAMRDFVAMALWEMDPGIITRTFNNQGVWLDQNS